MDLSPELAETVGDSFPATVVMDLDTAGDTAMDDDDEDEDDELRLGDLRALSCSSASFWLA